MNKKDPLLDYFSKEQLDTLVDGLAHRRGQVSSHEIEAFLEKVLMHWAIFSMIEMAAEGIVEADWDSKQGFSFCEVRQGEAEEE